MPTVTQFIQFTPEELAAERKATVKEAIAEYIKEEKEKNPVPKEKIMATMDWGVKKFYAERKKRQVAPVETWGNVPFYRLSDFIKTS